MAEELAKFHQMTEGTAEDYAIVAAANAQHVKSLPNRLIEHMMLLDGDHGGFAVDRLEHSVQTATRAHQAGENEEYVVAALLHDMGDILCPSNHADMAATILKPFVDEDIHWMVEKHAIFQGYYFFDFLGLDKNMRDQFKGHPCFEKTAQFCHLYDQNSFDPKFESMKLEDFRPMLERVFARPKNSIYLRDAAE